MYYILKDNSNKLKGINKNYNVLLILNIKSNNKNNIKAYNYDILSKM